MDINCEEIYPQFDFIEFRDGSSEESPLLGKLCGNGSVGPSVMMSTQNFMRIR